MERQVKLMRNILLLFFLSVTSFSVSLAGTKPTTGDSSIRENPFTAKASLIRYWNKHISNNLPKPPFLLSKASPLSAVHSAVLANLAAKNALSDHLSFFCSAANLFCLFDASQTLDKNTQDANFNFYSNKRFSNYGKARLAGADLFKNYSRGLNFASGSFTRYSPSSTGHKEGFTNYANDANVADTNFTSYGSSATGGSGDFTNYVPLVNIPNLHFTSYDSDGNNHKLLFSSYADDTNSGSEGFTGYGKNGNGVPVGFTNYGHTSNIIGSTFTGYGELGNGANNSFKGYTSNANIPTNNFKSYSAGGDSAVDTFTGYRDGANTGTDSFQSYGKKSNSAKANFVNYGNSFHEGMDTFKGYGEGSTGRSIGFKIYGLNSTFKGYADHKGVTFAGYGHASPTGAGSSLASGISVNKWVEPGKFFREYMLKEGTVMQMPDIRDKMPKRSFLPRVVSSKLPFSTLRLSELKEIFHARNDSSMERVITHALAECERGPSPGETKRCVGSTEDMIDFAVSVLGRNVVVRTTDKVSGSKESVIIGKVQGINGGKVTKSVSCHQSLYPYLLYYCHSVPKVRVYVADILDVKTKGKINRGVAICHLDTSAWSPGHAAFVALGSSPGLIEVCHWIFENDMTWTIAD